MVMMDRLKVASTREVWSQSQHSAAVVGATTILDRIGNTPLLDLGPLAHRVGVPEAVGVYAKAEWFNPGGSIKDRAALRIILDAEASGALTRDKVLIDSTSGNTGIAYAMIGAAKGYEVHLVMPANVSAERKALARAYGARLIESDALEGSDGAIRLVRKLVAADPGRYFYADQYNNPSNWRAHYDSTGPEIWRQTGGRVTHLVAGLGTTGTFVGIGRFLKEINPSVELTAVQPEDELQVIEGLKHLETAIVPGIYDETLADRQVYVAAETAWKMTRRLGREAGLFVGLSAGAATVAALEVARGLERGMVVTLLPDDGSKYLSLGIFDEEVGE
jgi:cysteine synthase B